MHRDKSFQPSLVSQYRLACRQTDELFGVVDPACLIERPVAERHRLMFYIGHLEAFDCNLWQQHGEGNVSFDADLDHLFAFGIDPVGGGLPTDTPEDWPSIDAIMAYRDRVRMRIEAHLLQLESEATRAAEALDASKITRLNELLNLAHVTIEHRQMHAETLAYLIHQMSADRKRAPAGSGFNNTTRAISENASENVSGAVLSMADGISNVVRIPSGEVTLGRPMTDLSAGRFGWDNEFGDVSVSVPAFEIDRWMISNGDFLTFMAAGGYREARFWRPQDWAWQCTRGANHPAFWSPGEADDAHCWYLKTFFDRQPLPLDWPVYVSYAEAYAYASFVGKRLPSEAQWMRAAEGALDDQLTDGTDDISPDVNADFRSWNPIPVHANGANRSRFGVEGQFGNGWEWTSDVFAPLPGFEAFSFYPGYSANFFDDQHFVMKGGSHRTAARMIRASFRNWFQPHYPYVYVGFRCVREIDDVALTIT